MIIPHTTFHFISSLFILSIMNQQVVHIWYHNGRGLVYW